MKSALALARRVARRRAALAALLLAAASLGAGETGPAGARPPDEPAPVDAVTPQVPTGVTGAAAKGAPAPEPALADLGRLLFHDPALSKSGSQSCATCHDPTRAFTDPRTGRAGQAVSVGHDGRSHGVRNTPTLSYAALTPRFQRNDKGVYKGGQFWDGRADDLKAQAGMPMLNPVEMGMPDPGAVVAALRANPGYGPLFDRLFGRGTLDEAARGFDAAAEALAAYQRSDEFSPFDSKYDRFLRGEAQLSAQEAFGRYVFVTWNCRLCHMERKQNISPRETFTSFEYHNIGVPANPAALAAAGRPDYVDQGLLEHPGIDDPAQGGRFRVPTLRNIAITAPYMHNGVFADLRTTIVFYNKYTSTAKRWQVNPETGGPWGDAEVGENLSNYELRSGLSIDDARIDALVAFLETLTDRRYEPLLEAQRAARASARTQPPTPAAGTAAGAGDKGPRQPGLATTATRPASIDLGSQP